MGREGGGTKKNGVRERRKGPFINDVSSVVRVRGLARICSKEERLRELLLTRREEIPKIWLTSLMNGPKGKKEEVGGSSGGWPNCSFYPTIALAGR